MRRVRARVIHRLTLCLITTVFTLAVTATTLSAQSPVTLEVGKFSAAETGGAFPNSWKPLTFEKIAKHTEYSLVDDNGTVVVKAVSRGSASGLVRAVDIDPMRYPVLEWRWKVENILKKGDVTRKDGDDYPARLYVTFRYDPSKVGFFERAKYEAIRMARGNTRPWAPSPTSGKARARWEPSSPTPTPSR